MQEMLVIQLIIRLISTPSKMNMLIIVQAIDKGRPGQNSWGATTWRSREDQRFEMLCLSSNVGSPYQELLHFEGSNLNLGGCTFSNSAVKDGYSQHDNLSHVWPNPTNFDGGWTNPRSGALDHQLRPKQPAREGVGIYSDSWGWKYMGLSPSSVWQRLVHELFHEV